MQSAAVVGPVLVRFAFVTYENAVRDLQYTTLDIQHGPFIVCRFNFFGSRVRVGRRVENGRNCRDFGCLGGILDGAFFSEF